MTNKLTKALKVVEQEVAKANAIILNEKTRSKYLSDGWAGCLLILVPLGKGALLIDIDQEDLPVEEDALPNVELLLMGNYILFGSYKEGLEYFEDVEL